MRAGSCVRRSVPWPWPMPIPRKSSRCEPISTGVPTAGPSSASSSRSRRIWRSPTRSASSARHPNRRPRWRRACSTALRSSVMHAGRGRAAASRSPPPRRLRSRRRSSRSSSSSRATRRAERGWCSRRPPASSAAATLHSRAAGTEVAFRVSGLHVGDYYWLWVTGSDGDRIAAGTFRGTGSTSTDLVMTAALPLKDARRIWVTDEHDKVVLDRQLPAPA